MEPNIYAFDVTYEDMILDLKNKDLALYTSNGLLQMLDRNRKIKVHPQRFMETSDAFDVIFTCEEKCFEVVCEGSQ